MSEMDPEASSAQLDTLLAMARDKTRAGRAALAKAVGDLFFDRNDVLTDRERALMGDILRHVIHDVEMVVRRRLAERMAQIDAPHDLIVQLANDEIEVAHPILQQSDILHDTDLVEIIHHRTLQHQLAIAMRRHLSETVSDALVETGNEDVIKLLLDNPDARISSGTMEYLVEQSRTVDTYQNPLLRRPDLEPDLARRMYWWVSAALRQHIVERFEISAETLDETLEDSVREVIGQMEAGQDASKPAELAERMHKAGHVTTETMIRVLRQGEIPLFEAMLGKLTGLRPRLLRRILFEPGGEALAVIGKAVDFAKADFATIYMLTRRARSADRTINPRDLTRVLALYDRIQAEVARSMLLRWQRNPEYLNALRLLNETVKAPANVAGRSDGAA